MIRVRARAQVQGYYHVHGRRVKRIVPPVLLIVYGEKVKGSSCADGSSNAPRYLRDRKEQCLFRWLRPSSTCEGDDGSMSTLRFVSGTL